jgi:hypothetical protein
MVNSLIVELISRKRSWRRRKMYKTLTGKFLLIYFAIFAIVGFFSVRTLFAGTVNIHVNFAYNGPDELNTLGFKLYQQYGEDDPVVIATIEGGDVRTWEGSIEVPVGRSFYTMTAYSAEQESPHSSPYSFEYIESETPGMPAPTVIFKFQ